MLYKKQVWMSPVQTMEHSAQSPETGRWWDKSVIKGLLSISSIFINENYALVHLHHADDLLLITYSVLQYNN